MSALSWLFWLCVSELRGKGWAPAGGHGLGLTLGRKQGPSADGNSAGRSVADMALCEGGNERGREDRGGRGGEGGGEEPPQLGPSCWEPVSRSMFNVNSPSLFRPETRQILMNTVPRRGAVSLVRDGRGDPSLCPASRETRHVSTLHVSRARHDAHHPTLLDLEPCLEPSRQSWVCLHCNAVSSAPLAERFPLSNRFRG